MAGKRVAPRQKPPFAVILILSLIAFLVVAAAAAWLYFCYWVDKQETFFSGYYIENVDVGGMTVAEAAKALETELTGRTFSLWLDEKEGEPDLILTAEQLGLLPGGSDTDYTALAQTAYDDCRSGTFLSGPLDYYRAMQQGSGSCYVLTSSAESVCQETAYQVVKQFSYLPVNAKYTVEGGTVTLLTPKPGRILNSYQLMEALNAVRLETKAENRCVVAETAPLAPSIITAQEIRKALYVDMTLATYDKATGAIVEGVTGVDFDAEAVQQMMDTATPGEYTSFQLTFTPPAVNAEMLEQVMFRDVLATYTTSVAGTAARKNNVQLSAKAINGFILNHDEVFSYNGAVGKRTAARGYQAAPAYVGGETVDEIGGGICQTSSTLYMATLLANMEITERRPHRYATTYMPYGMDATVSWGGPDFKFTNNTDYPIRIETKYVPGATTKEDGTLTVTIYGTKVDDISVKMTYEYLQRIDWTTEYEEDPTMAPGTQKVKTSAYVGHKVQTYRELYDGQGNLISKTKEAYSYYKARNRVVVRGPALPEPQVAAVDTTPEISDSPAVPGTGTAEIPGTVDKPADTPASGGTPDVPAEPAVPNTPVEPAEPALPDVDLPPA